MNCKQGELAFIVNGNGRFKPYPQNIGRIVRCVVLFEHPGCQGSPVWLVKSEGTKLLAKWQDEEDDNPIEAFEGYIEDANLRPINPEGLRVRAEKAMTQIAAVLFSES